MSRTHSNHSDSKKQKLAEWWDRFKNHGDQDARKKLIVHHLPLVKHIAQRLKIKLSNASNINMDELISAGHIGLIRAVDNFETDRDVAFSTFAWIRIRGAMLDDLRENSWIPRLVRKRAQRFEQAHHKLLGKLHRIPSEKELMKELKVSPREFAKYRQDANPTEIVSIQALMGNSNSDEQDNAEWALPPANNEFTQERMMLRHDLRDILLRELTRTEYFIMILYYHEGLRMKEIAPILEISESRISQKHTEILERFRKKMQEDSKVQVAA